MLCKRNDNREWKNDKGNQQEYAHTILGKKFMYDESWKICRQNSLRKFKGKIFIRV